VSHVDATANRVAGIDWIDHWRKLVLEREGASSHGHSDPRYWDRRAATYARSTTGRVDEFLAVVEPFVAPRKTLIDVGAGAGRHAVPLAERMEWVTAVEPSEGMRAHLPDLPNLTVVASAWEDAEVAPADLVICCHVLYGVAEVVPFIEKLERSARERVFVMLREGSVPHPANVLRDRIATHPAPRITQFSDLFLVLLQLGIHPDVRFISYPVVNRYRSLEDAIEDCAPLFGDGWNDAVATELQRMLVPDGDELVYDGGVSVSGIAHWRPRAR
jgi:SAM-dependent methyltransferase